MSRSELNPVSMPGLRVYCTTVIMLEPGDGIQYIYITLDYIALDPWTSLIRASGASYDRALCNIIGARMRAQMPE